MTLIYSRENTAKFELKITIFSQGREEVTTHQNVVGILKFRLKNNSLVLL